MNKMNNYCKILDQLYFCLFIIKDMLRTYNKRKNLFLDLDNTIICSEEYSPNLIEKVQNYDYDFIPPYITVGRPHLQMFLDYVFSNFNVGIWTAASKNYASFIYDRFIKKYDTNRRLTFLLYNVHCNESIALKNGVKDLSVLWDDWHIEGFNKSNTFILDDLKEVYEIQPDNCIKIKPFKLKILAADNELLSVIEKLKEIQKKPN